MKYKIENFDRYYRINVTDGSIGDICSIEILFIENYLKNYEFSVTDLEAMDTLIKIINSFNYSSKSFIIKKISHEDINIPKIVFENKEEFIKWVEDIIVPNLINKISEFNKNSSKNFKPLKTDYYYISSK